MMMLTIIIVVMGRKIFKCGLLMMISPGRRPNGNLTNQGHSRPIMMIIAPIVIRIFCMSVEDYALEFRCMGSNLQKAVFEGIFLCWYNKAAACELENEPQ
jgi:hypothetical protein